MASSLQPKGSLGRISHLSTYGWYVQVDCRGLRIGDAPGRNTRTVRDDCLAVGTKRCPVGGERRGAD